MVLNDSAQALLGLAGTASMSSGQRDAETGEKREKLRRYEHPSAQVLNVAGVSPIHECSNKALWTIVKQGNKGVSFFSEFCSTDPYRQGIAGSRNAESMLSLGAVLKEPLWDKVIEKTILDKARAEFGSMQPHLEVLNGGHLKGQKGKSLFALAQKVPVKDKVAVENAAAAIHAWLTNDGSAIRGFLQIMSWGGVFYASMCSDKVARCAMDPKCGAITKEQFQAMMVARLSGDGPAEEDDNSNSMAQVSKALLGGA